MRHRFALAVAIFACAALVFVSTDQSAAQEQKSDKKPLQYSGRVNVLSKDAMTISIQAKSRVLQIKYTEKTKFTFRNKPGSIDDVKEGRRVIVLVDPDKQKDMVALRIDVREGR